ncbi:MAG: RelA/SpoT domain-containing protein [Anaerolineaceae bacterium]|nr:RelA/SpoT domain-containing protein [Anaerolineaceae bacterium]
MRFPPVPSVSKKKINKAGQTLTQGNASSIEKSNARELAYRWRACHAYPINTFQSTLRTKLRNYPCGAIVAQRLKRMPTIIDKLQRYPAMQLTTMQDIGGVRAILETMKDVTRLVQEYKEGSRFRHELVDEKNYIEFPRSEDGYRSHHLIYKYRNTLNPAYDGLRIELQIRTKLQHVWATAVETMGTFLGQALKSRQGDQEWLDFFAVTSSSFSHKEKCPPIPRFKHLSHDETNRAVAEAETAIKALEKMSGFSIAANEIASGEVSSQAYTYHLIILDSLAGLVRIQAYGRDSYEKAVEDYSHAEDRAAKGEKIEPVLVSAGRVDTIMRAYPNFFLDIREFMQIVDEIVSTVN